MQQRADTNQLYWYENRGPRNLIKKGKKVQ